MPIEFKTKRYIVRKLLSSGCWTVTEKTGEVFGIVAYEEATKIKKAGWVLTTYPSKFNRSEFLELGNVLQQIQDFEKKTGKK